MEPLLLQMLTIRAFDDDSRPDGVLHEGIRQGLINGESRAIASTGGRREHRRSELDELFNHGGNLALQEVPAQVEAADDCVPLRHPGDGLSVRTAALR